MPTRKKTSGKKKDVPTAVVNSDTVQQAMDLLYLHFLGEEDLTNWRNYPPYPAPDESAPTDEE